MHLDYPDTLLVRADCDDGQFRCDNGQCTLAAHKCDGGNDCNDKSDEGFPQCNAPNTTLAVGDTLEASLDYSQEHSHIGFLLCREGYTNCSRLWTAEANALGELRQSSWTGCNAEGVDCQSIHDLVIPDDTARFPTAEITFVVEHRPSELAVWLKGHPEHAAVVPAIAAQTRLRVKPRHWVTDMAVRFGGKTKSIP